MAIDQQRRTQGTARAPEGSGREVPLNKRRSKRQAEQNLSRTALRITNRRGTRFHPNAFIQQALKWPGSVKTSLVPRDVHRRARLSMHVERDVYRNLDFVSAGRCDGLHRRACIQLARCQATRQRPQQPTPRLESSQGPRAWSAWTRKSPRRSGMILNLQLTPKSNCAHFFIRTCLQMDEKLSTVVAWNQLHFPFHSRPCSRACPEASR